VGRLGAVRAGPTRVGSRRSPPGAEARSVASSNFDPATHDLDHSTGSYFDTMTLSDVKAWAEKKNVSREDKRVGFLQCVDVPLAALGSTGPTSSKLDGFSPASERLLNITGWRDRLSGNVAVARMDAGVASMREQLGALTREAGARSASYLAAGPMHTAIVSYRFKDYIADVSATNIPGRSHPARALHVRVISHRAQTP
jgi:hypothetical protein